MNNNGTFVFLVCTALVDFQCNLHNDVEQDVNKQDPCGPPWYMSFPKTHSNEHVRNCNSKATSDIYNIINL